MIAICPAGFAWRDRRVLVFGSWPLRAARWVPGVHRAIPRLRRIADWYLRDRPDARRSVGFFIDQMQDPSAAATALRTMPRAINELARCAPPIVEVRLVVVAFEDDPLVDHQGVRRLFAGREGVTLIIEKHGTHTPQVIRPDFLAELIHRLAMEMAAEDAGAGRETAEPAAVTAEGPDQAS